MESKDELVETPLIQAAADGELPRVQVLLAAGANVRATNQSDSTAVMAAAINGHKDTVHVLVKDCGADVHAANNDGQ